MKTTAVIMAGGRGERILAKKPKFMPKAVSFSYKRRGNNDPENRKETYAPR